jgi:hypothetical protein
MVAPPLVTIENVHWARDGPKFACRIDGRDASYIAKYNLIQYLRAHYNATMEPTKLGCPSTQKEDQGIKVTRP